MRPQYEQLGSVDKALKRAGADGYSQRWGVDAELDTAAELMPLLRAKYGPRRDVTDYMAWQVIKQMAMHADKMRLQDHVAHYMRQQK